jgi:hypothetical protein
MPPNSRPGEDPTDIIDGTRKWKASERSILAKDLAAAGPKKIKTGKKKPVTKKTTTTVVKSTVFMKESR